MFQSSSRRAVSLFSVFALAALATACGGSNSGDSSKGSSSNEDSCGCNIEVNGDKQTLSCGQSACIGGSTWSCSDDGASQTSASCETSDTNGSSSGGSSSSSSGSAPSASTSSSSSSSSSGSTPTNYACDQLASYCSSKCASPASVNSDCVDTANAGDATKCSLWTSINGTLCMP